MTVSVSLFDVSFAIPLYVVAVVGFELISYTVNETDGSQEICLQIFNPPPNEQLAFTISLVYQSLDGTASKLLHKTITMSSIIDSL